MVEDIRGAGGEIYAITSEPQRLADDARREWELPFETIGDPHHEISSTCRDRGWLDLIVNTKTEAIISSAGEGYVHRKGYYQPGVLALTSEGRVLYRWRSIPTRKNLSGAVGRPTARHVFEQVTRGLAKSGKSPDAADAPLDVDPASDSDRVAWPLFLMLLVANGWFIRPLPFASNAADPSARKRLRMALLRNVVFIAAWVTAFLVFPPIVVVIALATWIAWITPGILKISKEFQNLPDLS